ncbi:MAG: ABC transporter permease, partial [Ruminococcus sp.]|nr:ABC transporter permease [Ruminococcus sp.]
MQVFKAMFKITKKRLPSALAYIIIFIVISVIAASTSNKDNKFEITKLKICIFDEDGTPESRDLSEFIGKTNDIVEIENDRDVIIDSLYYKRADYALIINEGYAEKLRAGDIANVFGSYCLDESFSTVYMGQFLDEYTNSVKAYLSMGMSVDEALRCTEKALSQETDVSMLRADKGGNVHYSVDFAAYFQYMPYILISAVFIIVCQVLVTMNR